MMGDEEHQSSSETPALSEHIEGAPVQQPDQASRKSRKRTTKKPQIEAPAPRQIKRHTAAERADKMRRIEDSLSEGGVSLKAAVEAVGISDQTYYQWKRAEKPAGVASTAAVPVQSPDISATAVSFGNELTDLIKLEEENQRLRQLLGEKLKAENAELRRRLELD